MLPDVLFSTPHNIWALNICPDTILKENRCVCGHERPLSFLTNMSRGDEEDEEVVVVVVVVVGCIEI